MFFEFLQQKPCRIIYKFRQKFSFGSETCEIGPKVVIWSCPDLSRRTSTYCKPAEMLLFFQILHLSLFFISKIHYFFVKSSVLLREFIIFYKIIGFTKRIYHFYKIISFYLSIFFPPIRSPPGM